MYDFHMHSQVSFDGRDTAVNMANTAAAMGLKEICFTDHMDYDPLHPELTLTFDVDAYSKEYKDLYIPGLSIRYGFEFGMLPDNQEQFDKDVAHREWDFVLGSAHFAGGQDVYLAPYWTDKTPYLGVLKSLEETLTCVKNHDAFDVLAHLTFVSKAAGNPYKQPAFYKDYREVVDEILKVLICKGKGLEINTSGMDACGDYLPGIEYLRRFKELGGEIVTVGSDAHHANRVGQYCREACKLVAEIFGYVCTYERRKPQFHRI